jgi:hypothetical protein
MPRHKPAGPRCTARNDHTGQPCSYTAVTVRAWGVGPYRVAMPVCGVHRDRPEPRRIPTDRRPPER